MLLLKVCLSMCFPCSGVRDVPCGTRGKRCHVPGGVQAVGVCYCLKCTFLCVSPVQACVTFPAELAAKDAMCPVVFELWAAGALVGSAPAVMLPHTCEDVLEELEVLQQARACMQVFWMSGGAAAGAWVHAGVLEGLEVLQQVRVCIECVL